MKTRWIAALALFTVLCLAVPASGQLVASRTARIAAGQQHLFVSNVEAHKAFWITTLGGVPAKVGSIVKFENALIVLGSGKSRSGTKGSIVDHLGFQVPNLRSLVEKLKANGYPIVTRAELPPQVQVTDGIGFLPDENAYVAVTMAPDEVKVEFVENRSMSAPLSMHHVHFAAPNAEAMRAWYVKTFAARPGTRGASLTAELPGVSLTFSPASGPTAPTKGRVLDHIGLEIKDLERFCKELESNGITFDPPYTKIPAQNAASAFLIDPWGTQVELTEGLVAF